MKTDKYLSEIDSNRFKIKVAKVNNFTDNITEMINCFRDENYKLIISRINSENLETINTLISEGFKIMDCGLIYSHTLKNSTLFSDSKTDITLRKFRNEDMESLEKITAESFNGYGHYFADKRLGREDCLETYIDWIRNSCLNPVFKDNVFVAEYSSKTAGFLVVKLIDNGDYLTVDTGLGAIDSKFRGKGIFTELIRETMNWARKNGATEETVTVLATNYSVNKSYTRLGFTLKQSFQTLHGWL